MSENLDNKQLPVIKVKVGDQVYVGKHDAEKGVVILEDGRIVRVGNPQPKAINNPSASENGSADNAENSNNQNIAPGIQKPQTALEKREAKIREMAEREAQRKEQLSQKGPNVSNDKKGEAERKKQEAIEQRNISSIEKTNKKKA